MHSGNSQFYGNNKLTLFCDQSKSFQRNLVALVRQWDKGHVIRICPSSEPAGSSSNKADQGLLSAIDQDGAHWLGAEAVPIVFKNLPFGKLAAAMYILPGTMWVTKQLYDMDAPTKKPPSQNNLL
jgi:predicted DCC family thiol-disulfide oxidoreductase YuxK